MPSLRLLGALLILLLVTSDPALAQGLVDAYSVRGIEVDVTAANTQAAKDQAIAEGQRQAFRQLLERLTQPADQPRLPKADGAEYVRDFSVEHERATTNRYIATLTVRFSPAAVRKLLRDAGIAYAEPRSAAVVIVPVQRSGDANSWMRAWTALGPGGLVPLTILEAEGSAEPSSQQISEAHRGADVMVISADLAPGGRQLDVTVQASANAPKPFDTVAYTASEGEAIEALLARAARDIQRAIDTVYKQPNLLQFDRAATISALVPLAGMEDWLSVRESLGKVSQVRKWELISLSRTEAAVTMHVVGDQEQVKAALARQGLRMEWGEGYWTVRPPRR